MVIQEQWVGIDISKTRLDVALQPAGLNFNVSHDSQGHDKLIELLRGYSIAGIVLEATGGLERSIMSALKIAEYPTRRVNPTQVRYFAKAGVYPNWDLEREKASLANRKKWRY